ncbi:hypothetical protein Bca101_004171 [Brassica carinata]
MFILNSCSVHTYSVHTLTLQLTGDIAPKVSSSTPPKDLLIYSKLSFTASVSFAISHLTTHQPHKSTLIASIISSSTPSNPHCHVSHCPLTTTSVSSTQSPHKPPSTRIHFGCIHCFFFHAAEIFFLLL